jgi:hypothetical protein
MIFNIKWESNYRHNRAQNGYILIYNNEENFTFRNAVSESGFGAGSDYQDRRSCDTSIVEILRKTSIWGFSAAAICVILGGWILHYDYILEASGWAQ